MTVALVLGGASTLFDDILGYCGPVDGVVACNDAGITWPGELDAWVSLHCRYFKQKGWRQSRAENGYTEAKRHVGHHEAFRGQLAAKPGLTDDLLQASYFFPGMSKSGSSGMFAAKYALVDLGFDEIVLCGIPMTKTAHFWDETKDPWGSAFGFRKQWLEIPEEYRDRMKSMSGWTRILLGSPAATEETTRCPNSGIQRKTTSSRRRGTWCRVLAN